MRKWVVTLAVLLLSMTLVFGVVEIEFWHAMGGGHGEALKEIVEAFNNAHPDIHVKAVYVGNYGALSQKLLASAQSGTLPVISQAYSNWTAKLIQGGFVQPLNDFINDPEIGMSKAEWEDIFKPFRDNCTWGDTVYAVPFNKSTYILVYNTDVFDLEGLEPPKDMTELLTTALYLTQDFDGDGQIDQYGFGLRPVVDTFQVFLAQNGGAILTKKEDGTYEVTVNSPEAVEALQFMHDLVYKYQVAYMQGGYLDGPFGDGKIAMYISTSAGKPYIENSTRGKHGWSWVTLPKWKTFAPLFAGTDIIMFNTATEEQKRAAWQFMKYLMDPQVTVYWAIKTGYLPVRESALQTEAWKAYVEQDPKNAVPVSQAPYGIFDPQLGVWYEIRTVVGNAVSDAMYNKKGIKEALDWAASEIEKLLKEEFGS